MSLETGSYLPARMVWERYGVASITLHRWLDTPEMDFPKPLYLDRYRYWLIADLEAWERSAPRQGTAA